MGIKIRILFFCVFCAFSWLLSLAAEEPPPAPQIEIYNLAQLLSKAERIVVAEVGADSDKCVTLNIQQVFKEPKPDPKQVDPEVLKRAQALLENDKLVLPPLKPEPPAVLKAAVAQGFPIPSPGTQAIFFLWDKTAEAGNAAVLYRLSHPQCVYDLALLPQVKLGLARPREVADGRYLRDWDRQMAERAQQREASRALLKAEGGRVVMGLRLKAARPALALRGDNSFSIAANIENVAGPAQLIYDGPAGGYGALLRTSGAAAETGIILRLSAETQVPQTDGLVLGIAESTDFTALPAGGSMSKDLFFDAKVFPVLKNLRGKYMLSLFFISTNDGKKVDLEAAPWTGAVVSDVVPFSFPDRK